jgi:predicted dithiol-disulfide oxidoreductase (DUF899 family)
MTIRKVVADDEWRAARQALLAKEKRFTRLRDELTAERQAMPWRKVQKDYEFEGEDGTLSLVDLFADKKQLLVYHFMFGPDWEEGCPSCSFWADNYNGIDVHLAHRDTTLLAIANTSIAKIAAYKKRMGWSFNWVSAHGSEFNKDFNVTFSQEEMDKGEMYYNFHLSNFPAAEAPGISVFYRDESGNIFHTYSTYARGLDMLNGAYHMLDLTPLGRDEKGAGKHNMYWLRRRDSYDD